MASNGSSDSTREVQQLLASLGFPVGPIDGIIGPRTRRDIGRFQLAYDLGDPLTVDTIAGPLTTAALRHSVNDRGGRCSENFWYREFRSNGNGGIMITRRQVRGLETLRAARGGIPLSTVSDYRDPEYNRRINGAARSMHLFGVANDLPRSYGAELQAVRDLEVFSGIGWKRIEGRRIVLHVDTRGPGQSYVDESGRVLDVPVTTSGTPADPTIWEYDPDVVRWERSDLPDIDPFGAAIRRVVLIAEDDGLDVRLAAGGEGEIIGSLAPGTVVGVTGSQAQVGSATWFEIASPAGPAWVDAHFLAEVVADDVFAADERVIELLDRLAAIIGARGDLGPVASSRGLSVSHNADPVAFGPDQLGGVLTDATTYAWRSNAVAGDDPDALPGEVGRTFTAAVADSFAATWGDPNRVIAFDQPLTGGNGRRSENALPAKLTGFHYVSILDPGDDPDHLGIDWTAWHASIDYENDEPVLVGLTLDHWAP